MTSNVEPAVATIRAGDEAAFVALVESHRRELHIHCYRMLGSLEDSEDLVQETVLRAWRARGSFEGRSSFRGWLYKIATNACLDLLRRSQRRVLPPDVVPPSDPNADLPVPDDALWLDPYPESPAERVPASEDDPLTQVVDRETIELAFLAAIQHLTPSGRAVLILRDVLGWSAKETAETLTLSVASVNSSLQRARRTLEQRLPRGRLQWQASASSTEEERNLLHRYMAAHERGDIEQLAELLREDIRISVTPYPLWYTGRDAVIASAKRRAAPGRYRYLATTANGQPAAASYVKRDPDGPYVPLGIDVLRVQDGAIAEITVFMRAELFPVFGLPPKLD